MDVYTNVTTQVINLSHNAKTDPFRNMYVIYCVHQATKYIFNRRHESTFIPVVDENLNLSDSPIEFATKGENLDANINLVVWTLMISIIITWLKNRMNYQSSILSPVLMHCTYRYSYLLTLRCQHQRYMASKVHPENDDHNYVIYHWHKIHVSHYISN